MCLPTFLSRTGHVRVLELQESDAIGRAAADAGEQVSFAGMVGPTPGAAERPTLDGAVGSGVTWGETVTMRALRELGRSSTELFGWTIASLRGP